LWLSFHPNYAPLRVFIFGLISGFDAFSSPGNDASSGRDQKSERHQDLPVHSQDMVLQSPLKPDENGNRAAPDAMPINDKTQETGTRWQQQKVYHSQSRNDDLTLLNLAVHVFLARLVDCSRFLGVVLI
jgi:hypothetical protein